MRILMAASEASPFAKTGGLADVLGSLPPALVRLDHETAVVLPRYREVPMQNADLVWIGLPIRVGPRGYNADIYEVVRQGVRYFLIDCPPLYDRAGIYNEAGADYPDNPIRFAALNLAALAIARRIFRPEVFHVHDWQAALLPVYLRENLSGDPSFFGARCVLTIHNVGYQGIFPESALAGLGLSRALFHREGFEFYGSLNFLKAGIVWADAVTTVSPTYAREIQTPEYGFGLDGLLRSRAYKLSGILNGADYGEWNPETDLRLAAHFSASDLSGKCASKLALLDEMGLARDSHRPLIGVISRFASQKGMELVAEIAGDLTGADLVVLGSGEAALEETFRLLALAYPDRIALRLGYDEGLAHRIEAGSDMLLMPSRYEPCGLNQIYSLRYGTVPIVRATGGLEDTVDESTGFKFRDYSAAALSRAIRSALDAFQDRDGWIERMRRGMAKDFSWDASAIQYERLYRGA